MAQFACTTIRKVSHLPPAKIISELMKAAPARLKRRPSTSAVVVPPQPRSSSSTRRMACFVSGKSCPSRDEDKACSVTPRARSRTSGGISEYASPATQCERRRLMLAVDMRPPCNEGPEAYYECHRTHI